MQSKAATVADYLAGLPADRRTEIEKVRQVILANLDRAGIEEGMQYGMIGYFVPHRVHPAGYHCDPRQPLPVIGLASQKNHCSLYLMALYLGEPPGTPLADVYRRFVAAWKASGKKLDMGKACIRFKRAEDLALDVVGDVVKRVDAQQAIAAYTSILETMAAAKQARGTAKAGTRAAGRKAPASAAAKRGPAAKPAAKAAAKPAPRKKAAARAAGRARR